MLASRCSQLARWKVRWVTHAPGSFSAGFVSYHSIHGSPRPRPCRWVLVEVETLLPPAQLQQTTRREVEAVVGARVRVVEHIGPAGITSASMLSTDRTY